MRIFLIMLYNKLYLFIILMYTIMYKAFTGGYYGQRKNPDS